MYHRIGKDGTKYWGQRGAGMLFTDGHNILLVKRSKKCDNAGTWANVGGKVEENETFLGAAQRESKEEIGKLPTAHRIGEIENKDGHHIYKLYVCLVNKQFGCKLNDEHDDYGWFNEDEIKDMHLHPKLKQIMPQILNMIKSKPKSRPMSGFAQYYSK